MLNPDLISLLALSLLGSIAGLIGGVIILLSKKAAKILTGIAVPLAAGVLLSVSFLDLLPEAVNEAGPLAFPFILSVFVGLYLVERFLFHLHHHDGDSHGPKSAVPLVLFGDTIHNFMDGVAIAASFMIEPSLGLIVALSTFLHETPHEIADFGILLAAGWSKSKAFMANFISAVFTIPGAILTYYFANRIENSMGVLLSLAAGLFLYVAATDFLPETKHAGKKETIRNVIFLLLGILIIAAVGTILPEH